MKRLTGVSKLDQLGMTASIACAIHCAAMPFLISTLPLWGLSFLAHSWVEAGMICLSLLLGAWSLGSDFPKHRKLAPAALLIAGFALIGTGHYLLHELEAILIPMGGFTIATAHFFNWKYSRSCQHK